MKFPRLSDQYCLRIDSGEQLNHYLIDVHLSSSFLCSLTSDANQILLCGYDMGIKDPWKSQRAK